VREIWLAPPRRLVLLPAPTIYLVSVALVLRLIFVADDLSGHVAGIVMELQLSFRRVAFDFGFLLLAIDFNLLICRVLKKAATSQNAYIRYSFPVFALAAPVRDPASDAPDGNLVDAVSRG
jgi:hypothetical protein